MKNKLLTILFCIALVLFMLTFAIGLPIYCRFLYYIQIKTLNLEAQSGFSYDVIKHAYDEVLNYCTLAWVTEFSAGELKFSESGAAHFADCKVLFNLNLSVLICSAAVLITLILLHVFKKIEILTVKGHHAYFYSAIVALALPLIIGGLAAINFDKAFEIFHSIFFPGKENWVFRPWEDEIIKVMPEEFFMNCAIIIGVGLVAFAAALITTDLVLNSKRKKNNLCVSKN